MHHFTVSTLAPSLRQLLALGALIASSCTLAAAAAGAPSAVVNPANAPGNSGATNSPLIAGAPRHAHGDLGSGTLFLPQADGGEPQAAPLLATDVSINIVAMTARVKVSQTFRNASDHWTEGVYVFPLPDDAAVDQLRMQIGERVIVGEIQAREQARQTYANARAAGQRSSLVEQQRANIFTTSVANIDPRGEVRIDIEYQQAVSYRDGQFSLRFPMVVAPRYIPGTPIDEQLTLSGGWSADTDQVADASRITPPVGKPADGPINPLTLRVELRPGMPLAALNSSYHKVRIEQQVDNAHNDDVRDDQASHYHIVLDSGTVPADRDFELVWSPRAGLAPRAALFTEQHKGATYALLMLTPPGADTLDKQASARDLTFVIDTSGSMHGDSIKQARAALIRGLRRLQPGDRFNVIRFSSSASRLFGKLTPASADAVTTAINWVDALQAEGGTEMADALSLALPSQHRSNHSDTNATPIPATRLHQVVFLTDGAVGNEAALFDIIRTRLGNSRLFPVGIGSAPNSYFMRRAARFGRGSFTHIGNTSEVAERMDALLRRLEYPALTDLKLTLPDGITAEIYPDPLPDLYLGEPIQVALRLPQLPQQLTLGGQFQERPWNSTLRLDQPIASDGIRVLWARQRIASLIDQSQQSSEPDARVALQEQVRDTALQHHLVSPYTSLVAVDTSPARPAELSAKRHAMAVNLPAGWSYTKVFGMAQGATSASLQLLSGALLMLAAAALWLHNRRRPTLAA